MECGVGKVIRGKLGAFRYVTEALESKREKKLPSLNSSPQLREEDLMKAPSAKQGCFLLQLPKTFWPLSA